MGKKTILVLVQVNFPEDLLGKVDARCPVKGDRSEFVRTACREKLERLEEAEHRKLTLEVPAR